MLDAPRFEWNAARQYLEDLLPQAIRELETPIPPDITGAKPGIGPAAAQLLTVLTHATRPKRALEVGTGLGYSAIAIGRALQQVGSGTLTTIEIDPRLADAARSNIADAARQKLADGARQNLANAARQNLGGAGRQNLANTDLRDFVEVITGDANQVIAELSGPFDLILQDGHKPDYVPMLPRLVDLLIPHGLLVSDDVLFPVMDLPESATPWQDAIREYNEALKNHPELWTTWLPLGDGVAVSVKVARPS